MEQCKNCKNWKDPDAFSFGKCEVLFDILYYVTEDSGIIVTEVQTPNSFCCNEFEK